jgi:general transcriptional corepressor TUP1
VRLCDVQTGQLIERLVGHKGDILGVAFTPDGQGLVSGSKDKTVKHWDVRLLLGKTQREALLKRLYDVGVEDAGSAAEQSVENEGVCVCTVNLLGHTVRGCLHSLLLPLLAVGACKSSFFTNGDTHE